MLAPPTSGRELKGKSRRQKKGEAEYAAAKAGTMDVRLPVACCDVPEEMQVQLQKTAKTGQKGVAGGTHHHSWAECGLGVV